MGCITVFWSRTCNLPRIILDTNASIEYQWIHAEILLAGKKEGWVSSWATQMARGLGGGGRYEVLVVVNRRGPFVIQAPNQTWISTPTHPAPAKTRQEQCP